jgi:ABC-type multidrug transport system fused ATPase/permease subunit
MELNTQDNKVALLFRIMKIYDDCIRALILSHKKKNENIGYKINRKYYGTWIYFIIILTYFVCSLFYIFPEIFSKIFPKISQDNLFIPFFIIGVSVILILFSWYEEKYPQKRIEEETGVKNKKRNCYDLFYLQVADYSNDKLRFLNDYIEHLLSGNKTNNNVKFTTLIFIPFMIKIAANDVNQIGDQGFGLGLIGYLFVGAIFVSIYNLFPYTFNYKILKLIRVKRFIEYALLCRRMEGKKPKTLYKRCNRPRFLSVIIPPWLKRKYMPDTGLVGLPM